ncbi:MAG: GDP-mannose 4,6-dehydratase, partial [Verrucomicrobiaceae bacterium]|nr:GDP-mannose 4,6-dehydratase [Verrucomicrobiaceae bacterium]
QCLRGQNVHLGAVHPTRDLNFVQNTVEGFCAAALSPKAAGQAINFGSGREISVGDLAILIGKMMGKEVEIVCEEQRLRPTKSEVERLLACNKKAKELCNWEPRTTLEQGLEKTIAFIEANVAHYQAKGYVV